MTVRQALAWLVRFALTGSPFEDLPPDQKTIRWRPILIIAAGLFLVFMVLPLLLLGFTSS